VEAGELLASTLAIEVQGEAALDLVEPAVQRIQTLRSQIRQAYLPEWSEQKQLQQEFARQGLDLVALDLTIALENLNEGIILPDSLPPLAASMVERLYHIGQDLQLASGWGNLLGQAEKLIVRPQVPLWRSQWPRLLQALKACALKGGESVPFELPSADTFPEPTQGSEPPLSEDTESPLQPELFPANANQTDSLLTDMGSFLDGLGDLGQSLQEVDWTAAGEWPAVPEDSSDSGDPALEVKFLEESAASPEADMVPPELATWIIDLADREQEELEIFPVATADRVSVASDIPGENIQVPVPLERLDQSAQDLITALLSLRSSQGLYQTLYQQILQLVSLAQEGAEHITRLRQIQDDYALIDNLKSHLRYTGPTPERYRQGYTTINRLLETSLRLSELGAEAEKSARQMNDSLQFLDNSILQLQATVEESRLMPFRNLAFRARAILRDLTTRFQKPARLVIQGERTELDVGTVRSLEPALLHLIRNAFDHALESPKERQAAGKPEQGTLTLCLQRQGNTYRLDVQDDGRGINPDAIRDRALALGLPLSDTSTPTSLLAVICQPGFSSETEVSDLSGRGVGMDVVANQVAYLGGKLSLDTIPGQGTTFTLQFPVTHLLEPCVLLRAGDCTFALPIADVKTLALLETLETTPIEDHNSLYAWQVEIEGHPIPGLDLLTYWQPQFIHRAPSDTAICAYVESRGANQGIWLQADDLLGQYDLLITPLPHPLQAPVGLMGVSLQPDGTLAPVLDSTALVDWLGQVPPESVAELAGLSHLFLQETTTYTPPILIVDDAALMRRRLEASLNAYGHSTHTCIDGLDAWNWLQANPMPALVITDIEMPNMDGFTLIDRCRQAGMKVPILVVSSRLSEDWFDEAKRLGANDYLTKGFSTLDLINKVNQLLVQESPALSGSISR
jgi:chemotaxis protein histidine kinase CheA/ActR/RegA family two-component response regulator